MARVEPAHRVRHLRGGILYRLRLVQHHQMPGEFRHLLDIARQHRVGRDYDVHAGAFASPLVAIETVQHDDAQVRREPGKFGGPVRHQAGRHHDQRGPVHPARRFLNGDVGNGLGGFAQPHVIGEQPAEAVFPQVLQPVDALLLIRAQARGEARRQRHVWDVGDVAETRDMRRDRGAILPARGDQFLQVEYGGRLAGIQLQCLAVDTAGGRDQVVHHR